MNREKKIIFTLMKNISIWSFRVFLMLQVFPPGTPASSPSSSTCTVKLLASLNRLQWVNGCVCVQLCPVTGCHPIQGCPKSLGLGSRFPATFQVSHSLLIYHNTLPITTSLLYFHIFINCSDSSLQFSLCLSSFFCLACLVNY